MASNLRKEDLVISHFLEATGPWSDSIVIGGGYALIIYKLYLVDQNVENSPVGTSDIDSLIPRKLPKVSQKDLANHLREADFQVLFKDYETPATQSYMKKICGEEVEIEFLTDTLVRKNKDKNIVIGGVTAQPLRYLELSLVNATPFQTYKGHRGRVVSPDAWIFHKGLTFPRRNRLKKYKDLYGVWYAATQLEEFSKKAVEKLHHLFQRHPSWAKTFQKNISLWIENATPQDWVYLEMQDPTGKLKKNHFLHRVNDLLVTNHFL
ncbi:MAG: hypothetical protein K940chlam9_01469 [Chlamydiae bacterium]|nr:hypothetical protein [Chlamydiota bacterium]